MQLQHFDYSLQKIFKNETSYFHDKIYDMHLENW